MKFLSRILVLLALPLVASSITQTVHLADSGQSMIDIVIPLNPSTDEKEAAQELKRLLKAVTGASFRILREPEYRHGAFVSIGKTELAKNVFGDWLNLPPGALEIRVRNGNLFLIGGTPDGNRNAVMKFAAEQLEFRRYSESWQKLPSKSRLSVTMPDTKSVPDFEKRFVFSATELTVKGDWTTHNKVMRWNLFEHADNWFCHTYEQICPMSEFAIRPELFAEGMDGKRIKTQLCPSHPEIIARAKQRVLETLRRNHRKDVRYISISENDGSTGFCHCARCRLFQRKYLSNLAPHLLLVNTVADAIAGEFPDVCVSFLVYSKGLRQAPTGMRLAKNTMIWYCAYNIERYEAFEDNPEAVQEFLQWAKLSNHICIWEYSCDYSDYFRVVPSLPAKLANLKFWHKHGVKGVMLQEVFGARGGDQQALRAWILAQALWDVNIDSDKLAREFCNEVFGKAAPQMYEYYRLVECAGQARKSVEDFYTLKGFLNRSNAIFEAAYRACGENRQLRERIDMHYLPIAFMEINAIFRAYPGNRHSFPVSRYRELLKQIKNIITREKLGGYSETMSMTGKIRELELLLDNMDGGVIGIDAVNGTLYQYPIRHDPLATHGKAPLLPCNGNWLVQWRFPANLCEPGRRYQLRVKLRPLKNSMARNVASAGIHYRKGAAHSPDESNAKSLVWHIDGSQLGSNKYLFITFPQSFEPEPNSYVWLAAENGADIGGLFVDRIELVPAGKTEDE